MGKYEQRFGKALEEDVKIHVIFPVALHLEEPYAGSSPSVRAQADGAASENVSADLSVLGRGGGKNGRGKGGNSKGRQGRKGQQRQR